MDSRKRMFHFQITDDYMDASGEYVGIADIVFDCPDDPQLYMYVLKYQM